ncbi:MAG: fatty acid desaturase [Candidatus Acidiferrum sp.]|jgi:fatty-acid desaturase
MRPLRFNSLRTNQSNNNRFNWLIATSLGSIGLPLSLELGWCIHRFQTPKWFEYLLTVCAVTAVEADRSYGWLTHRMHHQFTDTDGDPHSPREGKWWSAMGWILVGNALRQDDVTLKRYVPDFHVWITEFHFVPTIILGIMLFLVGGWPFLLGGIFFRTVAGHHATWLINSATHIWGSRRFETRDRSTNNWWVALLTLGEGWHNNHHAHPTSAQHGMRWYEFDSNWYTIVLFKQLGLASHVQRAKLHAPAHASESLAPTSVQI